MTIIQINHHGVSLRPSGPLSLNVVVKTTTPGPWTSPVGFLQGKLAQAFRSLEIQLLPEIGL